MEISFDSRAGIVYISIKKGNFRRTKRLDNETLLDYDRIGSIMGMELVNVSNRMHNDDIFHIDIRLSPYPAN